MYQLPVAAGKHELAGMAVGLKNIMMIISYSPKLQFTSQMQSHLLIKQVNKAIQRESAGKLAHTY